MRIEIQFSDGHKELFENATHAAKAMGITTPTVLSAKKLGKKRISRRRDKQEFQIHCENFPRIVISDRENEFSFPTLKEAEEFFDFPKILSSKVRFNHDMVVDMKNKRFSVKIIQHNGKPFPREAKVPPPANLQRTHKGIKVCFPRFSQKLTDFQKRTNQSVWCVCSRTL